MNAFKQLRAGAVMADGTDGTDGADGTGTAGGAPAGPEGACRQARAWALAAVAATALGLATPVGALALPTGLLVTVPLLMGSAARTFSRACLAVGVLLLPFALVAAFGYGEFLLLPSPLLLLAAAFATPGRGPGTRWALGAVAVPAGVAALWALTVLAFRAMAWP
ncbi:hypothetical protein ACGFXC_29385 [Streptomyces sp. NPDC048507]|uniref:hypothetical protein n=1 Tax=Streptomyces sp. NPDC048507 TaxID=3365560 RepID=UPI00371B6751